MPNSRLSASVEAASLCRRAEAEGGFAAILKRGDKERGTLLLVIRSRDGHIACLERMLSADGDYNWSRTGPPEAAPESEVTEFLGRRTRFDPDLWLIELDIAQPERFIAETTAAT